MQEEKKPFYRMNSREWFELVKVMMLWGILFAVIGIGAVIFFQYQEWKNNSSQLGDLKNYVLNFGLAGFCIGFTLSVSIFDEHHSKLWILGFPLGFFSWMICSYVIGLDWTLEKNIAAALGCGLLAIIIHFLPDTYLYD